LRIRLDAPPPRVVPPLRIVVEAASHTAAGKFEHLARAIEKRAHELLSVRPDVTIVAFGTFPRSSQKTKLIEIVGT
jgi:phenylacetate-CoA ligase